MVFNGCFTAIVTPFKGSGVKVPVNWGAFKKILQYQDNNGISGIVACGSTGESATLSIDEHNKVIDFVVNNSKGMTIGGTGSNSTWEAVEMTRHAQDVGALGSLQVCPYYNKPNQEGLYQHFSTIAHAVDIPIILYNVPSRTITKIDPDTMARLAKEHSNIIGVKEATGDREIWNSIRELCPKDFIILSGNDEDTYSLMKDFDAKGVISVASNILPKQLADLIDQGLDGNFIKMKNQAEQLSDAFKILFIDTNPIPIKYALNSNGFAAGGYRLPLTETSKENKKKIDKALSKYL